MRYFIPFIALFFTTNLPAKTQIESVYTSIKKSDCITVDADFLHEDAETDFYEGHCPSHGGYSVTISGGDLRYALNLNYGNKSIKTVNPGGFHNMASEKIEWRYKANRPSDLSSSMELTALIYRLNADIYNEDEQTPTAGQLMVVVRLKGQDSCVIGVLKTQKDMNKRARAIADNSSAPCLKNSELYP